MQLPIGYFKAEPTQYARISVNGHEKKKGEGISGIYFVHNTSIEVVGLSVVDHPFSFTEVTSDRQQVTLQGGIVYSVKDPLAVMKRYNHAVNPRSRRHYSDEPTKVRDTLTQMARGHAKTLVQNAELEKLLTKGQLIEEQVFDHLKTDAFVTTTGLEVQRLYVAEITPLPDIARALGATFREGVLQRSQQAEYQTRAKGVENERAIQQNEMNNKIELERRKQELLELQRANKLAEAQADAAAVEERLRPYTGLESELIRALALYELGKNASRISTLNIAPELLSAFSAATGRGA